MPNIISEIKFGAGSHANYWSNCVGTKIFLPSLGKGSQTDAMRQFSDDFRISYYKAQEFVCLVGWLKAQISGTRSN